MKKVLLLMGAVMITLSSCSRDEIKEVNRGNAIDFRTAAVTKAEEMTTGKLETFYVSAYTSGSDCYFSDVMFEKVVDHFVSSPAYYWPSDGSDLSFYAYSPSSAVLGASPVVVDGEMKLSSFAPADDISDQVDFIAAVATGSKTDASAGVTLEFNHALSQIEIHAFNTNTSYVYKVKGVRVGNVISSGTYDFGTKGWTLDSEKSKYEVRYENGSEKSLGTYPQNLMLSRLDLQDNSYSDNAMLIPQQLTAWNTSVANDKGSYIGVLVNICTSEGGQIFPDVEGEYDWVAVPVDTEWEAGVKYIYTLDFSEGAGYVAPEVDGTVTPGEELSSEMIFTLDVTPWNEENATNQVYADMIGTWKAYRFEQIDYYESGNMESYSDVYADHSVYRHYDENEVLCREEWEYDDKSIETTYSEGVKTQTVEKYADKTITIMYDQNGSETSRTEVEATNELDFVDYVILKTVAHDFYYFYILENNSNMIYALDENGDETGVKLAYTIEDNYMIIPALDGARTVPHIEQIVTDENGTTARLSIDRRMYPEDLHLQYLHYTIVPNN